MKLMLSSSFLLTAFLGGAIAQYLAPGKDFASSDIPIMIISIGIMFTWYLLDSNNINYKRTALLNIAVVAIAIFAIPYYLFRSRGAKGGFVGSFILLLFIILYSVIDIGGRYATYYLIQA